VVLGVVGAFGWGQGRASAAPPDPCPAATCRPKVPGSGAQAGVTQEGNLPVNVDRAETQVGHESVIIPPASPGASYSHSLVGVTETGYTVRMGYIVLGGDNGLARWFIRVYDSTGKEVYWKLSRAGEANPPPGCSACSGDTTTQGYPYSFGVTQANTWTFWFDWIAKAQVKDARIGKQLLRVYYLGEVTGDIEGTTLESRKALTTYRVTKGNGAWLEPEAIVYRANYTCDTSDGVEKRTEYDVEYAGLQQRNDGQKYHSIVAGSLYHVSGPTIGSDVCTATGTKLWP